MVHPFAIKTYFNMPIYTRARAIAMPQKPGIAGMYEQVEAAARTCYRSEGFTKYDEQGNSLTAGEFVPRIMKAYKHESVGEHGTVYLVDRQLRDHRPATYWWVQKYYNNPYSRVVRKVAEVYEYFYITTNYRVLVENGWEDDLKYWSEPTDFHIRRYTVRFFTDRGVSAESNRHRANSPTERSTRFVNYGHDGAITICVPDEYSEEEVNRAVNEWGGTNLAFRNMCTHVGANEEDMFGVIDTWLFANMACEWSYLRLLKLGLKPQQARRVLPMDIETELVVTAFPEDWAKYFGWRFYGFTGTPHPDIKVLTGHIMDQFLEQGWTEPLNLAQELYMR